MIPFPPGSPLFKPKLVPGSPWFPIFEFLPVPGYPWFSNFLTHYGFRFPLVPQFMNPGRFKCIQVTQTINGPNVSRRPFVSKCPKPKWSKRIQVIICTIGHLDTLVQLDTFGLFLVSGTWIQTWRLYPTVPAYPSALVPKIRTQNVNAYLLGQKRFKFEPLSDSSFIAPFPVPLDSSSRFSNPVVGSPWFPNPVLGLPWLPILAPWYGSRFPMVPLIWEICAEPVAGANPWS